MSAILFWILIGYFALNAVGVVLMVGRQRKPIDPVTAAIAVVLYAVWIVALFVWGGVR